MSGSGKLLAWIAPHGDEFVAAIVGAAAVRARPPATQRCSTRPKAREWVEQEAAGVDLPVEWVDQAPRR